MCKISANYAKTYIHKHETNFRSVSPFAIAALYKQAYEAGTYCYRPPFRLINQYPFFYIVKGTDIMHNGKYHCHTAARCIYHRPTIISKLPLNKELYKIEFKKQTFNPKNCAIFRRKKVRRVSLAEKDKAKEQQYYVKEPERREKYGIKWQPWDPR